MKSVFCLFALAGAQMIYGTTTITGPGIIPIGSALTWGGTNAPDTFSAPTTFSSTPVLVDNGKVKIWQMQVPTASNAEWDVFYMQIVSGGPLAGNVGSLWNLLMNYTLSAPANFDAVANQWLVNGTPVSPITNGIGTICCATTTNPILPGAAYYNSGFTVPLAAGVQTNWQQVYVTPYTLVSSGGINPNTANEFIFALHFTLQPPLPNVVGVVSASAFGAFPTFAPASWIEIYGTNLAAGTQTWTSSDFSGVIAPSKLGETTVTIGGQNAFIDYISSLQVNVQVPSGVTTGTQSLVVTTAAGSSPPFSVNVVDTQPGLLAPADFKIGGTQYVVAQFVNGTYVLPPGAIPALNSQRAVPGDTIIIYGIGFGPVTPNIPAGQIVEESNTLADTFTIAIGGAQASVKYYGLAPNFLGLYQFNVVVPAIPASDTAPVTFSLNGTPGTQTLAIAVGN